MLWEHKVAGSNPFAPTLRIQVIDRFPSLFFLLVTFWNNETERALSEILLYLAILGIVKSYFLKNSRVNFLKVIAIEILKDFIFDPFLLI